MRWKMNGFALSAIVMAAASVSAQTPSALSTVTMDSDNPPATTTRKAQTYNDDSAPIKGAPFCATVVTEHTQNLSDGNRIHTSESSQLCRDTQGRTRREGGLNLLGAAPEASTPRLITIVDPVAGFRYLLDTGSKTAQKLPISADKFFVSSNAPAASGDPGKGDPLVIIDRSGLGPDAMVHNMTITRTRDDSAAPPNSENLGDQTIEGIRAHGTRVSRVIPAGKMGNEKPITVTSERWFSSDLKEDVITKHDDPWAGELKTEFKNVSTAEPDPSLFTVPADYRMLEDKDGTVVYKLDGPSAPAQ